MSGHSKWAQIKHKKAASDAKKSQLFSKMAREIAVAARQGGAGPETNFRLRAAMEKARSLGLPKENIERAVTRASGAGESGILQEFLYEASAGEGIFILVEGITDNKNRTLTEIKKILSGREARLAEPGSLLWNFEKIGTLEIRADGNSGKNAEGIELAMIEAGVSDFKKADGVWLAETDISELENVRRGLQKEGVVAESSGYDYKPKSIADIPAEKKSAAIALLDELSEHDDVQEVYSNIAE